MWSEDPGGGVSQSPVGGLQVQNYFHNTNAFTFPLLFFH